MEVNERQVSGAERGAPNGDNGVGSGDDGAELRGRSIIGPWHPVRQLAFAAVWQRASLVIAPARRCLSAIRRSYASRKNGLVALRHAPQRTDISAEHGPCRVRKFFGARSSPPSRSFSSPPGHLELPTFAARKYRDEGRHGARRGAGRCLG